MAAAWGANTQAGPLHLASIVTDVQWEGAEGGEGQFQMFLPIWECDLNYEPSFSTQTHAYLY